MVFKCWKAFLSYSKLLMITLPIPVLSNSRVLLYPSEFVKMVFKCFFLWFIYNPLKKQKKVRNTKNCNWQSGSELMVKKIIMQLVTDNNINDNVLWNEIEFAYLK